MSKVLVATSLFAVALSAAAVGLALSRPGTIERIIERVGAVPGTDASGCFTVNGVEQCANRAKFSTGTTTLAVMRSPRHATSTLAFASCVANSILATTTSGGAGAVWVMAKDSGAGPTTTALGAALSLTVSKQNVFIASTTDGTRPYIFAPGDFVNVKYTNPGVTEYSQVTDQNGTCTAVFTVIN